MKKIIVVFVIFLLFVSAVTPIVVGFDSRDSRDDELECMLEKLRFICTDAVGFDESVAIGREHFVLVQFHRPVFLPGPFGKELMKGANVIHRHAVTSMALPGRRVAPTFPQVRTRVAVVPGRTSRSRLREPGFPVRIDDGGGLVATSPGPVHAGIQEEPLSFSSNDVGGPEPRSSGLSVSKPCGRQTGGCQHRT